MTENKIHLPKLLVVKFLLGAFVLQLFPSSADAVLGVWRRTARRTAVVVGSEEANANAVAQEQAAAAAQAAANKQAAEARQREEAKQAAARRAAAKPKPTPAPAANSTQQKLVELKSLYDQKLISQSDYEAAKTKVLAEMAK